MNTSDRDDELTLVTLYLCHRCLAGEGGECHTPGCALWMNRAPDLPLSLEEHHKIVVRARSATRPS